MLLNSFAIIPTFLPFSTCLSILPRKNQRDSSEDNFESCPNVLELNFFFFKFLLFYVEAGIYVAQGGLELLAFNSPPKVLGLLCLACFY